MNNKNVINILYTPDNNTYKMALVSIQSVIENNKHNQLAFYIAIDEDFDEELKDLFYNYQNKYKNVINVEFVNIKKQKYIDFSKELIYSNRIYILEAPSIINVEKLLFISIYSIVNTDLMNLYNTDISEYQCAGCEYIYSSELIQKYNLVGISNILSTNILLINTKNWEADNLFEKLKLFKAHNPKIKPHIWFILGTIISKFKVIDYKYDYTEEWWRNNYPPFSCSLETEKAYQSFLSHSKKPAIITYGGTSPISQDCSHSYLKTWWKYAKKTEIYESIKINKFKKILELLNKNRVYVNYSRMWPYIKPIWFRALLSMLICIPIGSLDAVIALALKPYMDLVMVEKSISSPWYIPLGIVAFTSIQGGLKYLSAYLSTWVGMKITNGLKFDLYKKLLTLPTSFYDTKNSGDVVFQFNNMADNACSGLLNNLSVFTQRIFSSVSLVCVLFYNSWQLALIAVFVLACAFAPVAKLQKRIKSVMERTVVADAAIITAYNETFNGNKTITSYNLQNTEIDKFAWILKNVLNLRIKMVQKTQWLSPMMHVIVSVGIAAAIGYGSHLIMSGTITSGNFVSFITALILLYTPVKNIGNNLNSVQLSFFAIEQIFNKLDIVPSIRNKENAIVLNKAHSRISFKNVNFEYIKNKPVLKNINLEVKQGETIALVGNSGGGKTTIVNLLPRFYDVKSGNIMIDNVDIRDYTLESLRDNIAVVFQDNFLFSGTIKENILLGKQDATDEEIQQALKMAYLDEFISTLKDGINTQIGERGMLLSGGQKQRVAIARAFLKNAPILILDEATSALDNKAEAIVQKAIDNLMKCKTVFVIAHRLSTIQNADRIAVINQGELVELGNHEELMKIENGQYKMLYDMQFKKQEIPS